MPSIFIHFKKDLLLPHFLDLFLHKEIIIYGIDE